MRVGRGLAGVAAIMLAVGIVARADDAMAPNPTGGNDQDQTTVAPAEPMNPESDTGSQTTAAVASTPAIMWGLDKIGAGKPLENAGIDIYGYVEGGYLFDMTNDHDLTPAKSAPADDIYFAGPYKNSFDLDQAAIAVDRVIDASKGNWDIGFKVEAMYGRDAFFTHSNGILDQDNKGGGIHGPDDQLDVPEAYIDFAIPVGNGITVTAGKMAELLGVEKIDPTQNLFYTHSYGFGYGAPYTNTGILGSYRFGNFDNDPMDSDVSWTQFTLGSTRGWNQTLYDNNGDPDGFFGVTHGTAHTSMSFKMLVGPEGNLPYGPPDDRNWWFTPDFSFKYIVSDDLSAWFDFIYGDAPHLTQWVSGALYAQYKIDKFVALNGRAEVYWDGNGITTGVGGGDVDYYALTLGLSITPAPDIGLLNSLTIRPELRLDAATHPVLDLSHYSQFTAAVDVYWKF